MKADEECYFIATSGRRSSWARTDALDATAIYEQSAVGGDRCLRQGEIVSNMIQVHIELSSLETDPPLLLKETHP